MKLIRNVLRHWLPLAAAIVLLALLLYGAVQQTIRQGANMPQVQLAEDAAAALAAGTPVDSVVPRNRVELAQSLAPYLAVFDRDGRLLATNAVLHGNVPTFMPRDTFEYALRQGEDRLTWQPEPGVRSATVIVPIAGPPGGFVLAGRSLREAERSDSQIELLIIAGCLGTLLATLALVVLLEIVPFTRSV